VTQDSDVHAQWANQEPLFRNIFADDFSSFKVNTITAGLYQCLPASTAPTGPASSAQTAVRTLHRDDSSTITATARELIFSLMQGLGRHTGSSDDR
jgi:hypothetical protein